MDAVQQAIAAAKAAQEAQNAASQPTENLPATVSQNAVTTPAAKAGSPLSMKTIGSGGMNVDIWLKPKEHGLQLGDAPGLIDEIVVSIDMTDGRGFVVKKGIKAGNPAQYWYTTDGVTCTSGGSWEGAVSKAKAISGAAYEYRCVDLPFTLLEDVSVKKVVIAKAGTRLGYTTSTTNWKAWEAFHAEALQAGYENESVRVKLTAERKVNKAGNVWGIVAFELLGSMAEANAEE